MGDRVTQGRNDCHAAADIVEIKHIMLPPSAREFKDIYVVFELMETDLHQVSPEKKWRLCPFSHGVTAQHPHTR